MRGLRIFLFIFLIIGICKTSEAQRFKAGVVFGFNASQIDGDKTAGFNKFGLNGGLRAVTILGQKSQLSYELLFSQRGSRSGLVAGNVNDPQKIQLDYIEVPVAFNYLDWLHEEGWYKFHFSAGLSYGRLLNVKIQDQFYDELSSQFNKNDLSILFGATFYVSENFGINARYTRSLTWLYNNNKSSTINAQNLLGYFLTFRGVYMF